MLLLRFVGSLLLRFAERQLIALLFQDPPRKTREEPVLSASTLQPGTQKPADFVNLSSGKLDLSSSQ